MHYYTIKHEFDRFQFKTYCKTFLGNVSENFLYNIMVSKIKMVSSTDLP